MDICNMYVPTVKLAHSLGCRGSPIFENLIIFNLISMQNLAGWKILKINFHT